MPIEFTVLRYKPRAWTACGYFFDLRLYVEDFDYYLEGEIESGADYWRWLGRSGRGSFSWKIRRWIILLWGRPAGKGGGAAEGVGPAACGGFGRLRRTLGGWSAVDGCLGRRARSKDAGRDAGGTGGLGPARDFLSQFESQTPEIIGSNNFVVSGEHTASGKPILANDTHLAFVCLGFGTSCI